MTEIHVNSHRSNGDTKRDTLRVEVPLVENEEDLLNVIKAVITTIMKVMPHKALPDVLEIGIVARLQHAEAKAQIVVERASSFDGSPVAVIRDVLQKRVYVNRWPLIEGLIDIPPLPGEGDLKT